MSIETYNIQWLDANGQRNYPLEDVAGKLDDFGFELPNGLLTDMHLWFPQSLGLAAFISSVTIGPALITLTINAHPVRPAQASEAVGFTPLAAVSVATPVVFGQNYLLTPFSAGVGGWVMFGAGVNRLPPQSYRFSDPTQTALLPAAAVAYAVEPGVSSINHLGAVTELTGIVKLKSGNPDLLTITGGMIEVGDTQVAAAIFQLNESVSGSQVFSQFLGPCGGTPASETCHNPSIRSLGGAVPDCNGMITLEFHEELVGDDTSNLVISYASTKNDASESGSYPINTAALDYNIGMSEICPPSPTGVTNDQTDNCDNPCDTFAGAGLLLDKCFTWQTGFREEPFYDHGLTFMAVSPTGSIDITGMTSLVIAGSSDDITILIPGGDSITQSPGMGGYTQGTAVTFTIPAGSLIFKDTSGWIQTEAVIGTNENLPFSVAKTITDGTHSFTWAAGSTILDGVGHVVDAAGSGLTLHAWGDTISITTLTSLGFITGSTFSFKFVHIVSGWGFADVEIDCPDVPTAVPTTCDSEDNTQCP